MRLSSHSLAVSLALAACPPTLAVGPATGLIDTPIRIRASGLAPGTSAQLVATTESNGVLWRSIATCEAGADGSIDAATCDSTAGSYTGVDAGGLLWSMQPQEPGVASYEPPPHGAPIEYAIELRDGGRVVATAHVRRFPQLPGVVVRSVRAPFVGTLALPPAPGKHPALVLLGGSEGGDSMADVAPLFASHGFATASVAYFGLPGLPAHLVDIPVETVGTALDWLAKQPGVDPRRIGVVGISKGGELALLAASTYPQIRAVVSVVGVPFSMYGIDPSSASRNGRGSWSKSGAELAYVPPDPATSAQLHDVIASGGKVSFGLVADASVARNPAAVRKAFFPLERIAGPVLCIGAGDDQLMNSSRSCDMALTYLQEHAHPFPDRKLTFPDAGHDVITFYHPTFGYQEFTFDRFTEVDGGTPATDGRANEVAWPSLLAFLEAALR